MIALSATRRSATQRLPKLGRNLPRAFSYPKFLDPDNSENVTSCGPTEAQAASHSTAPHDVCCLLWISDSRQSGPDLIAAISSLRYHGHMISDVLTAGDRIELSGGYDFEPAWLGERSSLKGKVESFIPGQNDLPAAVIVLDEPLIVEGTSGRTLVLEQRYVGATWALTGVVHVELCDFIPEPKRWQDRRQGKWVESHAQYKKMVG
jgi:hypothetical protein